MSLLLRVRRVKDFRVWRDLLLRGRVRRVNGVHMGVRRVNDVFSLRINGVFRLNGVRVPRQVGVAKRSGNDSNVAYVTGLISLHDKVSCPTE